MFKRFFIILLFFSAALSSFAVEDIYVTDTLKTLPQDLELRQLYLQALCYKKQSKVDSAMLLLKKYVAKDTTNGAVYMDIANLYISLGNSKESLANMQKAAQLEPKNYWIRRSEALLLIQNGKTNEGLSAYEKLVNDNPEKVEDIASLASLFSRVRNYGKAYSYWCRYENLVGITDEVSVAKFEALMNLGKTAKQAVPTLDSLVATDPTTPRLYVTKATSLIAVGEYKMAEQTLKSAQKKFPNSSNLEQLLAYVYAESGQGKKAVKSIKKILSASDLSFDTKRSILMTAVSDSAVSDYFGAEDYESLIKQYPNNDQAYLIYSDYLLAQQNQKGIDYLKKTTEVNPKNEYAWISLLTYYESLDHTKYNQILNDAYKAIPESGQIQFYMGTSKMEQGDKSGAVAFWRKSISTLSKNPSEKMRTSVVYGIIGDVTMGDKDTVGAFAAYDSALVYNSNNIEVLNNYAFFLSEVNKDLDKAEKMSGKAIAADPKNVTFLDTYAWVLYKQGKYSTARIYQEQAILYGGDKQCEIMDHYGDILYKDGDLKGAKEAWQTAVKLIDKPSDKLKQKAETGVYVE